MDEELTLNHIKSSVGDLYIVMHEEGRIKLVPCDVTETLDDDDYQDLSL